MLFARNFLKHPRMLGSVIPSSRFLIEQVLGHVDWSRADVVVEYGPGVGTITTEILRRMGPGGTLVVMETNPEFVRFLQESVRDRRLQVVHDSAGAVGDTLLGLQCGPADYVISGIPFSTMPEQERDAVLNATRAALRPDGAFLVYQFSNSVGKHLRRVFERVERDFEPRNVLPARVFRCSG